jgi:hypothetical protein
VAFLPDSPDAAIVAVDGSERRLGARGVAVFG